MGSGVRDALAALRHAMATLKRRSQPRGALAPAEHCSHAVPLLLEHGRVLALAEAAATVCRNPRSLGRTGFPHAHPCMWVS